MLRVSVNAIRQQSHTSLESMSNVETKCGVAKRHDLKILMNHVYIINQTISQPACNRDLYERWKINEQTIAPATKNKEEIKSIWSASFHIDWLILKLIIF